MGTDCLHRWVLGSYNGPRDRGYETTGVCKHCGTRRQFSGGFGEDNNWKTVNERTKNTDSEGIFAREERFARPIA